MKCGQLNQICSGTIWCSMVASSTYFFSFQGRKINRWTRKGGNVGKWVEVEKYWLIVKFILPIYCTQWIMSDSLSRNKMAAEQNYPLVKFYCRSIECMERSCPFSLDKMFYLGTNEILLTKCSEIVTWIKRPYMGWTTTFLKPDTDFSFATVSRSVLGPT